MPMTAELSNSTLLEWDPGDETIVPNNHSPAVAAFEWDMDEDTVVPGHHATFADAFNWN
jgi:hypothetical protein